MLWPQLTTSYQHSDRGRRFVCARVLLARAIEFWYQQSTLAERCA